MTRLCERVLHVSSQEAVFLLRNSLAVPRLMYVLRTYPMFHSPDLLVQFDEILRGTLDRVLQVHLSDRDWSKATLPLRAGGLGIRSPSELALPAYAASIHASKDLINILLPEAYHAAVHKTVHDSEEWFQRESQREPTDISTDWTVQRDLDEIIWKPRYQNLCDTADTPEEKARLNASTQPLSRKWLEAIPSTKVGTHLDSNSFRVCVGLKLGLPICQPHTCGFCQAQVDAMGSHGLSCKAGANWTPRHNAINAAISRALQKCHIPNRLEPPHLLLEDGKRPDGVTLIPFRRGRCLVWDVTVCDTLARTYIQQSAREAGSAARKREADKKRKYASFEAEFDVVPVSFETLGSLAPEGVELLAEICQRLRDNTKDQRSGNFFMQEISIILQRGNASLVLGSMMGPPVW